MTSDSSGPTAIANNATTGVMNGANGHAFGPAKAAPAGGRGGPYPHVDDLVHVVPDVDPSQPIQHLLSNVEQGIRSAQFQAELGRIDLALQIFMKALYLAVTVIPAHKDFLSLQIDRPRLGESYKRLTKALGEAHPTYETIKQIIKDDNARTGVQPITQRRTSTAPPVGPTSPKSPVKAKPTVQPKPANLHGNAVKSGAPAANPASGQADELKQRLLKLRNPPGPPPVQDPRIRTRPPIVPMPNAVSSTNLKTGPKATPDPPPKVATSIDSVVNQLPKVPDAIYSPARGSISSEAADLPSSTPRGMYSRSNSTAGFYPAQSTNMAKSPPLGGDYFTEMPRVEFSPQLHNQRNRVHLPEANLISVDDLLKFQKIGAKNFRILLIDLRDRADYDDGHILSAATICIEPDILQRPGIEASDVEDSMEVGPAEEKHLFERRHEFDIVVMYDQNSTHFGSDGKSAPARLYSLLTDFDYPEGNPASKHPKLLQGGLEAWQDSMGLNALQKSSSHRRRESAYDRLWMRSPTKPIQSPEEAQRWERHLTQPKTDEADKEIEQGFPTVRTVDDFLKNYPSVQESMTSPIVNNNLTNRLAAPPAKSPSNSMGYPMLPSEPTRPPPAVPRRSFTGLQPSDDDQGTAAKVTRRNDAARRTAIGLKNPGNWCYANSTLQALFASGGFGEELFTNNWENIYKSPKKTDEKIMPPQLLAKIMSNLFLWMGNGKFSYMQAKTLMDYLRHITSKDSKGNARAADKIMGSSRQMDAQEFFIYVFTELHDETNRLRDQPPEILQPCMTSRKSLVEGSLEYWKNYTKANDSIIDRYWRAIEVVYVQCDTCGHVVPNYNIQDQLMLNLPQSGSARIEELLTSYFSDEKVDDYKCDNCGLKGTCRRSVKWARFPDLLSVLFVRFESDNYGTRTSKISTPVDFPASNLDLTPYSVQGMQQHSSLLTGPNKPMDRAMTSPTTVPTDDHHFVKSFRYDAYAVVQHGGELMGGHYISVIRGEPDRPDGRSNWRIYDDSRIETLEVGPSRADKGSQFLCQQKKYWAGGMQAYMVFYQRRDAGLV